MNGRLDARLSKLETLASAAAQRECATCAGWPPFRVERPDEPPTGAPAPTCPTCGRVFPIFKVVYE